MRKVVAAVLLVIVAAGGWWYASPIWTLRQIRAAAKERNAEKLSAYVDYPALREDLKGELRRSVMNDVAKRHSGGIGDVGATIALAIMGPLVDAAVSPEGVEAMFAAQKHDDALRAGRLAPVTAGDHPSIERDGLDSFRVRDTSQSDGQSNGRPKGALVFHRSGLGWKLVGVDLPPAGS